MSMMLNSFEKENKILLACARSRMDDFSKHCLTQLVVNDINWDALVKLAIHHKLLPLLYKNLSSVCPANVPARILADLRNFFTSNSIQNLSKLRALLQIVKLFEKNGIDVLTVKGPLFTHQYYGDISLRCFCDIDILVRLEDFDRATKLICSLGYNFFPYKIPEKYFLKFAKLNYHGNFANNDGVHVELHWELSRHYRGLLFSYENISPFIEETEIFGNRIRTLNREMLLLYLALHGQLHYWQRYDYLCCVAELMKGKSNINWNVLKDISEEFKLRKIVFLAIYLAKSLIDKKIDSRNIEKDKDLQFYLNAERLHLENFNSINQLVVKNEGMVWKEVIPEKLRIIGSRYKLSLFKQRFRKYFIPQVSDWEKFHLPFCLNFLYFLIRPVNKISNYIRFFFANRVRKI